MKGTYCLIIENKKECDLAVGKKGNFHFEKGFYVYVGSALNSLPGRIKRHLSSSKKLFWHVDYLLAAPHTRVIEVVFVSNPHKVECAIAGDISLKSKEIPGFGSSDCRCNSHLFYFEDLKESIKTCEDSFLKNKLITQDLSQLSLK